MKVKIPERQLLMLETRFSEVLNPDHELLRAAKLIDWDNLHDALSSYYSPVGPSGKPIGLMVGIHVLKHRYDCFDERAVEMLHENASRQAFQRGKILDSTILVKFRNRIGTEGVEKLKAMTSSVVKQAEKLVKSLYGRGRKDLARSLNKAVSQGRKIITQTEQALSGEKVKGRIYSLHEPDAAAIKKGNHHPPCEFGAIVALSRNYDGLILSHVEYQHNEADVKTLGPVITGIKKTLGESPREVIGDRGFDQSLKKQENSRRRWSIQRMAIPKKGKTPHPNSTESWFRNALKKRAAIEPVIGHLKCDHRMDRCRYKGGDGDTVNVVWATVSWNTKKIVHLHRKKEERQAARRMKRAA